MDEEKPLNKFGRMGGATRQSVSQIRHTLEDRRDIAVVPFKGRESLRRTPPMSFRSTSRSREGDDIHQISDSDEAAQNSSRPNKKRKLKSSIKSRTADREFTECNVSLTKVNQKIIDLVEFSKRSRNVHKEVKEIVQNLKGLINKVATETSEQKEVLLKAEEEQVRLTNQVNRQTQEIEKLKEESRKQREEMKRLKERQGRNEHRGEEENEIKIKDYKIGTYEDLETIMERWPEGSFTTTRIINKDPLKENFQNLVLNSGLYF